MHIGFPELALTLVLAVGLHVLLRRRRSQPPSLLVTFVVSLLCLGALGVSLVFPERRGLAVGFLVAGMATGVLSGLLRSSLPQGGER